MKNARPDMRDYFRARIAWHTVGMMAPTARAPYGVRRIAGDVTSEVITVTMVDGTEWHWTGGRYSSRKRLGTYAPLMPRPINN